MKILNINTSKVLFVAFLVATIVPLTAQNTNLGNNSGTGGTNNSNFGVSAGENTTNDENTFVGYSAGKNNTSGSRNTFMGSSAGFNANGNRNTFLGGLSGYSNTTGVSNVYLGYYAGYNSTTGSRNVYVGRNAGVHNFTGSDNVFIGFRSGLNETGSHKLYVDNDGNATPLIYGDFSTDKIGINTKNFITSLGAKDLSAYSMFVKGGTISEEIRVRTNWADYVFEKDYNLLTINEVADFIKENGHLPNIPSAETVETEGLELGDITTKQQEKIEELTLYVIQLQKQLNVLKEKLKE